MELNFNFEKIIGKIKPMHAVGQPPVELGNNGVEDDMFHYLTEANIPYSRLHDTGGCYASNVFVDLPNLFRDFDADDNDPDSYDFAFTDVLLSKMIAAKVERRCITILSGATSASTSSINFFSIFFSFLGE